MNKILPAMLLMSAVGCQQGVPALNSFAPSAKPALPKPVLYVFDNGYIRQYVYDGGSECGWIQGNDNSMYLTTRGDSGIRYFVSKKVARQWVEQACPNAIPKPTESK